MDYKGEMNELVASEYDRAMAPLDVTPEFKKSQALRVEEVSKCNHLFVITRDEETYSSWDPDKEHYSAPTIECVHCGCSNRLVNYHNMVWNTKPTSIHSGYPFEAAIFLENFEKNFVNKKIRDGHLDISKFNLLSNEILDVYDARYWYNAAKTLKPKASQEELFETMKYLIKLFKENVEKVHIEDHRK